MVETAIIVLQNQKRENIMQIDKLKVGTKVCVKRHLQCAEIGTVILVTPFHQHTQVCVGFAQAVEVKGVLDTVHWFASSELKLFK